MGVVPKVFAWSETFSSGEFVITTVDAITVWKPRLQAKCPSTALSPWIVANSCLLRLSFSTVSIDWNNWSPFSVWISFLPCYCIPWTFLSSNSASKSGSFDRGLCVGSCFFWASLFWGVIAALTSSRLCRFGWPFWCPCLRLGDSQAL